MPCTWPGWESRCAWVISKNDSACEKRDLGKLPQPLYFYFKGKDVLPKKAAFAAGSRHALQRPLCHLKDLVQLSGQTKPGRERALPIVGTDFGTSPVGTCVLAQIAPGAGGLGRTSSNTKT